MAKQEGLIKILGTIGGITLHKSDKHYLAKAKGGITAKRMATDLSFQRTPQNSEEFGRACKSGKLLRTAMCPLLDNIVDRTMVSRLTQKMMRVIQMDGTSLPGKRNAIKGDTTLLEDFEFNEKAKLRNTFYTQYAPTINRVTGLLAANGSHTPI